MTRAVVFRTPGKLDLRSLTMFGLNAKPETQNPIGYFGTGLKYAIAVLMREDIPVKIWVGDRKWTLKVSETNFRGKGFKGIELERHKRLLGAQMGKVIQLPFTTELGKNWELWQAFRELYSNTLDEHGATWVHETDSVLQEIPNQTQIIVESEAFVQEFFNRDKTFLPVAMQKQHMFKNLEAEVQIFPKSSQHIYYRGIRIMDLEHPSKYTYNILRQIQLTEDRTAASEWEVKQLIAQHVVQNDNKEFITDFITAPSKTYEHQISLEYSYRTPSETFLDTVQETAKTREVASGATQLVKSFRPEPETTIDRTTLLKGLHIKAWEAATTAFAKAMNHMGPTTDEENAIAVAIQTYLEASKEADYDPEQTEDPNLPVETPF